MNTQAITTKSEPKNSSKSLLNIADHADIFPFHLNNITLFVAKGQDYKKQMFGTQLFQHKR